MESGESLGPPLSAPETPAGAACGSEGGRGRMGCGSGGAARAAALLAVSLPSVWGRGGRALLRTSAGGPRRTRPGRLDTGFP